MKAVYLLRPEVSDLILFHRTAKRPCLGCNHRVQTKDRISDRDNRLVNSRMHLLIGMSKKVLSWI